MRVVLPAGWILLVNRKTAGLYLNSETESAKTQTNKYDTFSEASKVFLKKTMNFRF